MDLCLGRSGNVSKGSAVTISDGLTAGGSAALCVERRRAVVTDTFNEEVSTREQKSTASAPKTPLMSACALGEDIDDVDLLRVRLVMATKFHPTTVIAQRKCIGEEEDCVLDPENPEVTSLSVTNVSVNGMWR